MSRVEDGVCILCEFPLLEGTNKDKRIQGLCEECSKKFLEKWEAMQKNPDLMGKGVKLSTRGK
jgi:hypothetical protein